ncbi:MAG: phage terminase large subunit [Patescibacteria group bacterium]|nr:phage terminase large subunit [Patescibacteria group bacterium]
MAIREVKTKLLKPSSEDILFTRIGELLEFNESLGATFFKNRQQLPGEKKFWDIYNAAPNGDLQIFLFYGGTGGGKSIGALDVMTQLALDFPGIHLLGVRATYGELEDTVQKEIKLFWDQYEVPFDSKERPPKFWIPNGTEWSLRSATRADTSAQDKIDKLGSVGLGAALLEEADELPYEYLTTLVARLRQQSLPKPVIIVVCNPPWTTHWIYQKFFKNNPPENCQAQGFKDGCPCGVQGNHNYHPIKFELEDNPFLPPGYIDNLKREYMHVPTLYKKFVKGEFGPSAKGTPLFRKLWIPQRHEKPNAVILPNIPIHMGWDFGYRHPAVVAAQEDPETGQVKVLWSQMGEKILLDDFAKKIKVLRRRLFPGAEFIDYCDPHGRNRDDRGKRTSIDILKENGIFPRFKDFSVSYGINIMGELLMTSVPVSGEPALVVDPRNAQLVADAFHFGYVQDPKFDEENKPDELVPYKDGYWEHPMDALRYILVHIRGDYRSRKIRSQAKRQRWKFAPQHNEGYMDRYDDRAPDGPRGPYYGFGRRSGY